MVVAVVAALRADLADDESALSEFAHCNPNKQQKILFLKAWDGSKTPPDSRGIVQLQLVLDPLFEGVFHSPSPQRSLYNLHFFLERGLGSPFLLKGSLAIMSDPRFIVRETQYSPSGYGIIYTDIKVVHYPIVRSNTYSHSNHALLIALFLSSRQGYLSIKIAKDFHFCLVILQTRGMWHWNTLSVAQKFSSMFLSVSG